MGWGGGDVKDDSKVSSSCLEVLLLAGPRDVARGLGFSGRRQYLVLKG